MKQITYTNVTILITQEVTAIQSIITYSTSFSLVSTSTWAWRISITCLDASYSSSVALKSSCNTDTWLENWNRAQDFYFILLDLCSTICRKLMKQWRWSS